MPYRKIDENDIDDAEGHMPFKRVESGAPESEDTDGQAIKLRPAPAATDGGERDDTEGNARRM